MSMNTHISSFNSNIVSNSDAALLTTSDAQSPRDADYRSISLVSNAEVLLFSRQLKLYALNLVLQDSMKLFHAHTHATPTEAQCLLEQCGLEVAPVFQQLRKSIGFGTRENMGRVKVQTAAQNIYAAVEAQLTAQLDGLFKSKGPYYLVQLTHKMSESLLDVKLGAISTALDEMNTARNPKDKLAYEYTAKLFQNVQRFLLNLNNNTYNIYTAVLDELSEEVQQQSGILSGGTRSTHGSTQTYLWTVESDDGSSNVLQEYLDSCFPSASIHRLRSEFIRDLLENRRQWCDLEQPQAVERIRAFIDQSIAKLCQAGPQDVFTKAFCGKDAVATVSGPNKTLVASPQLKKAVSMFLPWMKSQLLPLANLDPAGGSVDHYPSLSCLFVPRTCPHLYEEIALQAGSAFQVELSDVEDMIVGYRVIQGVPPHALKTVYKSEESYEASINKVGLHLSESPICDLRSLPNPIPVSCYHLGDHSVTNPREEAICRSCDAMFREAVSLGLAKTAAGSGHTFYELVLPQDPAAVRRALERELAADRLPESILALMQTEQFPNRVIRLVPGSYVFDAPDCSEPDYYLRQAVRILRQSPDLHRPLEETLASFRTLAQAQQVLSSRRYSEQTFLNCIAAGLITFADEGREWMYEDFRGDPARLFVPDALSQVERSCPLYFALEAFRHLPEEEMHSLNHRFQMLDRRDDVVRREILARLQVFKNTFETARINVLSTSSAPIPMGGPDFLQQVRSLTDSNLGGIIRDTYDRLLRLA